MSAPASTAARGFIVEEFSARRANTLRGFAKGKLPSGIILHDVGIYVDSGRAWASPSSKPMLSRDGTVLKDAAGKIRYSPIISFETKELRDRFSSFVVEAVRLAFPDELADVGGQGRPS